MSNDTSRNSIVVLLAVIVIVAVPVSIIEYRFYKERQLIAELRRYNVRVQQDEHGNIEEISANAPNVEITSFIRRNFPRWTNKDVDEMTKDGCITHTRWRPRR